MKWKKTPYRKKDFVCIWDIECGKNFQFYLLVFYVPDVTLDIDTLTNEQKVLLNQCAQTYGMKDEDFVW